MERVLIIGAGPAGISASLYAARAGFEAIVIHNNSSALLKAELIQNYFGFDSISGKDLLKNAVNAAEKLGVKFVEDEIVRLEFTDHFVAKSASNSYESKSMILAAGNRRKSPNIPGLKDLKGISYCAICDSFFYRNKTVAVIGFGDYAVSEIETLKQVTKNILLFTNENEIPKNLPSDVQIFQDKIVAIEGENRVSSIKLANQNVPVDGIFVAYGTAGSLELAREIGAVLKDGNVAVNADMMTNVPGLFAAGDCVGGLLQVSKAVRDGAIAGLNAVKFLRQQS